MCSVEEDPNNASDSQNSQNSSELSFLHGIFLTDKVDLSHYERSSNLANRHAIVKHDELIYGECLYALSLCGHSLMAIGVDICCFHKNNELFSKISQSDNCKGARSVIVVKEECIYVFEPLRYITGAIDLESITSCYVVQSAYFKKGDVVTYDFEGEKFYGIVKRCKLLNGVRSVGLKHSICGGADDVKFFLEDLIHKLRVDQFITTYFQGTVVDPRSILSCTQAVADDVDIGDAVRFTVSGKSLQGRALGIVEVNHTLAVVIGLPQPHTDDDILRYKINGVKLFEKLLSPTDDAVIVKLTAVRKKRSITCTENNVSVFDPKYITEVETIDNLDKVIIFTSKGEKVVAKLRMIGQVDGDDCIGCELRKRSSHGTDGRFGKSKLFDCDYGRGVLIPLADIADCCVKDGRHEELQLSPRGRIMESSVCCIDVLGQLRGKPEVQLGERVMRMTDNDNVFGTCRWKGLVNNKEVIGVEMARCGGDPCDGDGDGLMANLSLFDCIPNNTELFLSEGFTHVTELGKLELLQDKYVSNKFVLSQVDPRREGGLIGRLVSVQGSPPIYGRVRYYLSLLTESFLGVNVVFEDLNTFGDNLKDILFHGSVVGEENVIIARESCVNEFDEQLQLVTGRSIVDERSIKVKERYDSETIKKDDIVWYEDEGAKFLGCVVRLEALNGARCVGVVNNWPNAGIDNDMVYVREDAVVKTHPLKYLEDTVIDPRSVVKFVHSTDDDLNVHDEVEFKLKYSRRKIEGTVVVLAEVNDVPSVVVKLDNLLPGDVLRRFLCSKDVNSRCELPNDGDKVIVLMGCVSNRVFKGERAFFGMLVKSMNDTEKFAETVLDMMSNSDVKVPKAVISEWKLPIKLDDYPELLSRLIHREDYYTIAMLMDKFVPGNNDNFNLLKIARYFLVKGDHRPFFLSIKNCREPNVILDSGETFLTSVMKDGDEDAINRVIGTNAFDVNKTNKSGESPLVLACRRLMVPTVRLLMSSGAVASAQDNRAMTTVMDLRRNLTDPAKLQQAFDIVGIFAEGIKADNYMCKVCLDREVDTALNCNHTLCKVCSDNVLRCPICSTKITDRRKLIFS